MAYDTSHLLTVGHAKTIHDTLKSAIGGAPLTTSQASALATQTGGILAKVTGNNVFVANAELWSDLPEYRDFIFINRRYSDGYNLQLIYGVSVTYAYHRITKNDTSGTVYRDWKQIAMISDVDGAKSQLTDITGFIGLPIVEFTIVYCSGSVGSTVASLNQTTDSTSDSIIYECAENDVFYLTGTGWNGARLYAFLDSSNKILEIAEAGATRTNAKLIAPAGTAKLVVNFKRANARSLYSPTREGYAFNYNRVPNLKILALGDSICYGWRNGGKGFVGDLGLSYKNIGVGGATLTNVVTQYQNIPDQFDAESGYNPDIIIANGGINDYIADAPMGDIPVEPVRTDEEAAALDRGTIMGAMGYMFYRWVKKYPSAQRFFLIMHKVRKNNHYYPNYNAGQTSGAYYTQQTMHDAQVAICNVYGVKVVDVYKDSMINTDFTQYVSPVAYSSSDPSATADYYVDNDGLHPLARGYLEGYIPIVRQAIQIGTVKSLT